jgi:ABC-type lipoprotein release transport system permease subunit
MIMHLSSEDWVCNETCGLWGRRSAAGHLQRSKNVEEWNDVNTTYYHIIQYYILLHYIILYYIVLYYIISYHITYHVTS